MLSESSTLIYLDNNATTQPDPEVLRVMQGVMEAGWGNPSSLHGFGQRAKAHIERARMQVAALIGAEHTDELQFTSGGTESINSALHAALGAAPKDSTIFTSSVEHSAVREPLAALAADGQRVRTIAVDARGQLQLDALLAELDACPTAGSLVSLQWANNETGALLPAAGLRALSARCHECAALLHLDAVQVPGKLPMAVGELGVDLLSLSAHKFHGPQGVGALYVRRGALPKHRPLIRGGPQEHARRGGTENVAGIAGMGRAAELAMTHVASDAARGRVRRLRDTLQAGLQAALPGAIVHADGPGSERLDNTLSLFAPGLEHGLLLATLAAEGLAISSGAACSSSKQGPSEVLLAMGLGPEVASGSLRFSLSRRTTDEEIRLTLELVRTVAEELKSMDLPLTSDS